MTPPASTQPQPRQRTSSACPGSAARCQGIFPGGQKAPEAVVALCVLSRRRPPGAPQRRQQRAPGRATGTNSAATGLHRVRRRDAPLAVFSATLPSAGGHAGSGNVCRAPAASLAASSPRWLRPQSGSVAGFCPERRSQACARGAPAYATSWRCSSCRGTRPDSDGHGAVWPLQYQQRHAGCPRFPDFACVVHWGASPPWRRAVVPGSFALSRA